MRLFELFLVGLGCLVGCSMGSGSHSLPHPLLPVVKFQRGIQSIHEKLSQRWIRSKRDTTFMEGLQCMSNCMKIMLRDLKNLGIEGENGGTMLNKELLQGDVFEQYCDINQEGKSCLDQCQLPDSLKIGLNMAFSASEYVCVDHYDELRGFLSCYSTADPEISRVCTPLCGDAQELLERTQRQMQIALSNLSLSRVTELLEDQCKFLRCNVKCHTPILNRHCSDPRASELLNNMAAVTLRKAQNLLESVPFGGNYWPKTCRRIAEQGFPTVTNSAHSLNNENEIDFVELENDGSFFI